jgi:uncharacterized membrane protein
MNTQTVKQTTAELSSGEPETQVPMLEGYAGSLPPQELVKAYDKLLPGAAERIFRMVEQEQAHRHSLAMAASARDDAFDHNSAKLQFRGQLFGFALGMFGIGSGVFLAYNGDSLIGFGTVIASMAALVGAMLTSKSKSSADNTRKE